jgi:hypothetical protein
MRTDFIPGAPFQVGDIVICTQCIDLDIDDVSEFIGRKGLVVHLDYECGSGQSFPSDPMLGVLFTTGELQEFWTEELKLVETLSVKLRAALESRPSKRMLKTELWEQLRKLRSIILPGLSRREATDLVEHMLRQHQSILDGFDDG